MAKILCKYFGLSMAAEGKSNFVGRQAAAFLGYVQQDAERCAAESRPRRAWSMMWWRSTTTRVFPPSCTGSAA